MDEQRLIDANALREDWLENGENEYVYDTNSFLCSLDDAPTIDPETLPIVRELRAELARVTEERDAAVADLKTICDCDYCANDCVNIEEDCCEFCGVEGCLCRGCISGGNWTWRGPQKEASND